MKDSGSLRILMISDEGPQTGTAGGLLLHRLLDGHPPDRLRVITRYVPTLGEPLPGVVYQPLRTPWARLEGSRFNRFKRSLRAFGLVPPVAPSHLQTLVGNFQPDVVVCVMQHASYYDTAWAYAARQRLPLVVIVHDINDDFEPVLPWARAAAHRRDTAFYRFARRRLCVSPEMAGYCSQSYGAPSAVLYPNRSPTLRPRGFELATSLRTEGRLTIGFAGNLDYGYGAEIVRQLPALRAARARLVLYSRAPGGDHAALASATDVCEWRGFVPSAEAWAGIQHDCDTVWLPYPNPAGAMERLFRHHFPSKLPEYLALGLPVMITGPSFATGMRWAREHPWAVVSAEAVDPSDFRHLLDQLEKNPARRRELAEAAWQAGENDFSPDKITAAFFGHLTAAAQERPGFSR